MGKSKSILIAVIFVFLVLSLVLYGSFSPDDVFIHIAFAKDIAEGKGYGFAGNPTFGSSSPLWPLGIAFLNVVIGNYEITAKCLSLIFAVAGLLLFYRLLQIHFTPHKALVGIVLLAFNPYMLRWAGTGMETTATVFYMIAFLYGVEQEVKNKRATLWYLFLGTAPLIRFEMYSILFLFVLYEVIRKRSIPKHSLFVCIPLVAWNAYALWHFGTIVPNTYLAKANNPFFALETDIALRTVKLFLTLSPVELLSIITAGIVVLRNRYRTHESLWKINPRNIFAGSSVIVFYGYYGLKNVKVLPRYALFTLPTLILLALKGLSVVEKKFVQKKTLYPIVVSAACLYSVLFTWLVVYPDAQKVTKGFQHEYRKIAQLLREQDGNNKTVAASEIGIIGVYSGCRVYDLNGLVDRERFRYATKEEYLCATKPHFLISKGEIDISRLSLTDLRPLYTTTVPQMGINETTPLTITVYKVIW